MAREHARIFTSIWSDKDWTRLTMGQQLTYVALVSSPDLSWCGVLPLTPARFSGISSDSNERKIRNSIGVLKSHRFVVIDESTAEMLVRSFVRHDQIMKQPNVTKAMVRALGRVHSPALVDVVKDELARELRENPTAKGWPAVKEMSPELLEELHERATAYPSPNPSRNPSAIGSVK